MVEITSKKMNKSIVLIGLMGAGKSSIGWRLAKKLGLDFVDLDQEIEKKEKCSVNEIFAGKGEEYFRQQEKKMLATDLKYPPHVLAPGGGIFLDKENRKLLKKFATTIWLRASLDVLLDRVSRRNTRPLLEGGDKAEIMARLMEERYPLYSEADLTVDSDNNSHEMVVDKIMELLCKI